MVHWPLMGGLLHLVQRGGAWAGWGPVQSPPRCTKCNSPSINIVHNVVGLWTTVLHGHRACWGACNVVSGSFAGATCMATILLNRIGFNVHRQNMKLIYRQQNARKHVDLQPSTVPFKVLARQISLSYEMWSKNRVPGLPEGKNRIILCSFISTQYQCVTNRRTDIPLMVIAKTRHA